MPWMGAAIGAGSSLLGGLFGSKGASKTATNAPWSAQQPYLQHGFAAGQTALDSATGMGSYQGPRTAGLNQYQTQGYDGTASFASNQGMGAASGLMQAGQGTLGSGQQFADNAAGLYGHFGQDPTQQITQNAGQYANNPYLDGQIQAAQRDTMRNFSEQQMPGLDNSASASGNMNSSRTGVAQGIMQRGTQDRLGDISSQMRGNAYQNGLGMAQSQYNQNGSQQLNANGQLLSAGNFGRIATDAGLNAGYSANDALTRAGMGYQTQDQNTINGNITGFKDKQNTGLDLVNKYMQGVNGSFGSQTQSQSGGGLGGALQGAMTGLSGGLGLYGQYGNNTRQGYFSGNSSDPMANPNASIFNAVSQPGVYG